VKFICYNWMPTISDHIIDLPERFYNEAGTSRLHDIDNFNPYSVKEGDLIFVKTDYIINGVFATHFLDKIYKKFNLITGISSYHLGRDGGDSYKYILNHPNLNKWICTNPPVEKSEKIIPIPIGFQEQDREGGNQSFLEEVHNSTIKFEDKKDKILLPWHNPTTNSRRQEIFDYLKELPFVEVQKEKKSFKEYYELMNQYKFVIGIEGSGPDIHRNYETMLVGSIPINIKNIIQEVFEYHHASAVFLESWKDLDNNMFNKLLETRYNIDNNNKFLDLKTMIERVRRGIKL